MTQLRKQMIRAMELKNLSRNTQRSYLAAVNGLARHYRRSPARISKKMIEDYLLYLKNDLNKDPNTCGLILTGLRLFYKHVAQNKVPIDYSIRYLFLCSRKLILLLQSRSRKYTNPDVITYVVLSILENHVQKQILIHAFTLMVVKYSSEVDCGVTYFEAALISTTLETMFLRSTAPKTRLSFESIGLSLSRKY